MSGVLCVLLAYPYNLLLASGAEVVMRLTEWSEATRLVPVRRNIVIDRIDFARDAPRPELPMLDVTGNVTILAALLGMSAETLRPPRARRIALAFGLLFAVHVLALAVSVHALYATRMGEWSRVHYGFVGVNVWASALHFYRIAGRYLAPLALWWLASSEWLSAADSRSAGTRAERRRRGAMP